MQYGLHSAVVHEIHNSHLPKEFLDIFISYGAASQRGSWSPAFLRFLDHTQFRSTLGRIPLDKWSARRRDLYLIKHNTHNRQTDRQTCLPAEFEYKIPASKRPQTDALYRAAARIGSGQIMQRIASILQAWCTENKLSFYPLDRFSRKLKVSQELFVKSVHENAINILIADSRS